MNFMTKQVVVPNYYMNNILIRFDSKFESLRHHDTNMIASGDQKSFHPRVVKQDKTNFVKEVDCGGALGQRLGQAANAISPRSCVDNGALSVASPYRRLQENGIHEM